MRFIIHPKIFAHFPGLRVAVAVAAGIDNATPRPAVDALWREAWDGAQATAVYGNAQSHPRVAPWRLRFRALGVPKDFRASHEAMLRRALKGSEPFYINPLVDFYNAISLRHTVPAGGFELGAIVGALELRLSQAGDHFEALDDPTPVAVPPGEVAYADGATILTRHFVWRQARNALIAPETRHVFLVSEVLGEIEDDVAEAVLADFESGLHTFFGSTPQTFILDKRTPSVAWS
jgi:DNA/RNA-binding domain of Phe-tRNA-synthetase-like protein